MTEPTIDGAIRDVAVSMARQLDALLAAMPPGYRFCLHGASYDGPPQSGPYVIRASRQGHYLPPGQRCDEGNRTEYGPVDA